MRIGLVAGEASGDLLGAGLIREIRKRQPEAIFEGVAGPQMREAGCDAWEDSSALAVMGLIEPLREIPRLLKLRRSLQRRWIDSPPDVFVGIDAPDFNLGLEKRLRKGGIPTVHYVSPSVWAWRQRRIHKIASAVDRVLCLFPFEKEFFDQHRVAADFVGHPLADCIPEHVERSEARQQHALVAKLVVAVMPGSRTGEVERLGPIFAATARKLSTRYADIEFIAPTASKQTRQIFAHQIDAQGIASLFTVLDGNAQSAIAAADVVLLASGTASLEAALIRRPIVMAYRLSPLTYFIVRVFKLLKVKHFSLPNLLTREPLVGEFLQDGATPEALCEAVADLLDNKERREAIEDAFGELRTTLRRGADARAAEAVLQVATNQR